MKVKTEQLKELVSNVINGAGDNKLIPITQLMGITKFGTKLTLTTTDATNYFYMSGEIEDDEEDVQVTVFAEQFSKLVSRMTCKEIELNLVDNSLEVKGNGTYTLELPLDENGELIVYPDPYTEKFKKKFKWDGDIDSTKIKTIIESIKPSLATTMELPSIINYYTGDNVMATDRYKIASFSEKLLDKPALISSQLMDLISLMSGTIKYKMEKDCMVFYSENCIVYSKQVDDIEEYPVKPLNSLISQEFKSVCKVNKNDFIALLERIALFVGKYDDRAVRLYFEKDGIRVSNKSRKSNEVIEYTDSKDFTEYNCTISVDMLLSQLKAYAGDVVELHYNNDKSVKFINGSIIQIVALMEEE